MLDCHINAFLIKPGRVLGRNLRPLTLAHYWILEAVGSPYAYNQTPSYADTAFAVFSLSTPPKVTRWLMTHPSIMRLVFKVWGIVYRTDNMVGDMIAFNDYWEKYTAIPSKYDTGGAGHKSCLPSSVSIAWMLMARMDERRAWSMPLPMALCYVVAESENNGATYVTERDKYMAKMNEELALQHEKEKAASNG
jgi:hypothetical protein